MIRVRSVSMWGLVLGWAATRCCVPAHAEEAPKPPVNQSSSTSDDLAEPAPAPPVTSVPPAPTPVVTPAPVPVPTVQAVPDPISVRPASPIPQAVVTGQPTPAPANQKSITLEVVKERYPNKQVAVERHVSRDEKNNYINHGTWSMWDPDGRLLCQGEFLNGKAVGNWVRTFHEGGEDPYTGVEYEEFVRPFKATATFADDKLVGVWTLVDDKGATIHSWEFNEDRLNGKAVSYYGNGQIRNEGMFVNGVLDGEANEYDVKGNKLSTTTWTAGRRIGPTTQKYPSGAKYSEGEYFYAREDKPITYDFYKGTIHADKLSKKTSNSRHGHWIWWHEDGEKMCEGEFVDGKPIGHHVWYHANGQKEMEGDFVEGKRHGMWTTWHTNGQKKSEGLYEGGREAGQWFAWNTDGKVTSAVAHQPPRSLQGVDGQHPAMIANGGRQVVYQNRTNSRPRQKTVVNSVQRNFR